MAGGSVSTYPTSPKSPSSPFEEDVLLNLKFGTFNPNSQISDALISNDPKILADTASPSTDPLLKAANLQNAPTNNSFLARKSQDPRSEEVNFIDGLPVVSFDIGDKAQLVSKVNFVIVAKFSHGRPMFRDFQAFLSSLKFQGNFVVSAFDRKHVFIEFVAFDDFVKLWMMKSCVVKGFKARFFRWTDSFSPSVEISIAPVWISLPGLPLYLLEENALVSIASVLGKPLYIDPLNLTHRKVGAAWICVALDVSKSLPEAIWLQFMGEGKVLEQIFQRIVYHDLPPFCKGCFHLGHDVEDCKTRNGGRSVTGFENGKQDEHGALNNQIPVAVVLKGRQWAVKDKHLEEGEIDEETIGEESHMNDAKHSSEAGVSRIEGFAELKAISDEKCTLSSSEAEVVKEFEKHAEVSPHFTSAVNEVTDQTNIVISINPPGKEAGSDTIVEDFLAPSEEITIEAPASRSATNLTDAACEFRMEDANPFTEEIPNGTLSETEVALHQVVESPVLATCTDLTAPLDTKCTSSCSEAELVEKIDKHADSSYLANLQADTAETPIDNLEANFKHPESFVTATPSGVTMDAVCEIAGDHTNEECQADSVPLQAKESDLPPPINQNIRRTQDKLQEFIHTCEAISIGRDMLQETHRDNCNKESRADISHSAIPYVKKMIEKKVSEEWNEQLKQVTNGSTFALPTPTEPVDGLHDRKSTDANNDLTSVQSVRVQPLTPSQNDIQREGSKQIATDQPQALIHDGKTYNLQEITQHMATIVQNYQKTQAALDISQRDPEPVTPAAFVLELLNQKALQKLNLPLQLAKDTNYKYIVDKVTDKFPQDACITEGIVDHFVVTIAPFLFPSKEELIQLKRKRGLSLKRRAKKWILAHRLSNPRLRRKNL